jgi:hypothetical protein
MLFTAFRLEWETRNENIVHDGDVHDLFRKLREKLPPETLNLTLQKGYTLQRQELIQIFSGAADVGTTIEGQRFTIDTAAIDIITTMSSRMRFADEFLDQSSMTTEVFAEAIKGVPIRLNKDDSCAAGIMTDGTTCQIKDLTWDDPSSIQERFPDFVHRRSVLCVSHIANRVIIHVFAYNDSYRQMICDMRRVILEWCEPYPRQHLTSLCPMFFETR